MTIKQAVIAYLLDRGVVDYLAEEVLARIINDPATENMWSLWDDQLDDYPDLFDVLSATINRVVLAWVDEEHPQHSVRNLTDRSLFERAR